jgi:SAM-dependent methyltransferase
MIDADGGTTPKVGEYYDLYWSDEGFNPEQSFDDVIRTILQRYVRSTDECIDVGCGKGGGASEWLARHARSYLGVDVSNRALAEARRSGLRVAHINDASELPYPDESFDLAICLEVFEHLFDPQRAAREIHRVLRSGGRLIATVPNAAHWRQRFDLALLGRWHPFGDAEGAIRPWRDPHIRFFGLSNLGDMLIEAGFEILELGGHGGPFAADVPGLGRIRARQSAGPFYSRLIRVAPSLFGRRLHAVVTKHHSGGRDGGPQMRSAASGPLENPAAHSVRGGSSPSNRPSEKQHLGRASQVAAHKSIAEPACGRARSQVCVV